MPLKRYDIYQNLRAIYTVNYPISLCDTSAPIATIIPFQPFWFTSSTRGVFLKFLHDCKQLMQGWDVSTFTPSIQLFPGQG